jgi:hypothetical protein
MEQDSSSHFDIIFSIVFIVFKSFYVDAQMWEIFYKSSEYETFYFGLK